MVLERNLIPPSPSPAIELRFQATGAAAQTHGAALEFNCTGGRRIRGDFDNQIVVFCSDGVVSPPLSWPAESGRTHSCMQLHISPAITQKPHIEWQFIPNIPISHPFTCIIIS